MKVITKRNLRTYQEKLLKDLQDPELAQHYLNEALEDDDPQIFLLALKNIYEAHGMPITDLANKTHLSRENLYRILSNN